MGIMLSLSLRHNSITLLKKKKRYIVAESPKPSVFETFTHPPCVWILAGVCL